MPPILGKLAPVENLDVELRRTSFALRALDMPADTWSRWKVGDTKDQFHARTMRETRICRKPPIVAV